MSDLIERWYPLSEGFAVLREAMKQGQNHEEWARISPAEAKAFRDDFAKGRDLIEAQQAEIARLRELVTSSEQERYAKCGLLNLEVVQLREAVLALRDGYADAAAGLAYVKQYHGRLSGVGFDRVADRFFEIVTMPEREGLLAGGYHLPALSAQPNDQEQKP